MAFGSVSISGNASKIWSLCVDAALRRDCVRGAEGDSAELCHARSVVIGMGPAVSLGLSECVVANGFVPQSGGMAVDPGDKVGYPGAWLVELVSRGS